MLAWQSLSAPRQKADVPVPAVRHAT